MKRKVLYSACFDSEAYPFHHLAKRIEVVRDPDTQMTETDAALVVWGGADINPKLYGHAKSQTTHYSDHRDLLEWACIQQAIKLGIPMIGVCRGAQMMCAAAGGFLLQDVQDHAGCSHKATTYEGDTITINSIHHQMMCGLEQVDHELLAWCSENRSGKYTWKDDQVYTPPEDFKEPEMVYFPKIKALAIQWHPEAMDICAATRFIYHEFDIRHGIKETI
jgi:gamma-glutamyl-gamma-aminobutyrate hydrolase PuuD